MSRHKLCNMIGANYDLITRYYNNSVSRIDLDIIARICFVLNCTVDEIIIYEKK
ncbi:MAG: helix-turn-helix transcriptional regulator [Bacilli bacterium]|nr:helix-turn-helix transcriptional regulator [Bacilli bacterium]